MRRCRFPFAGDLNSHSGPDVLVAALSEALRPDPRFADLNEQPWGPDDVAWFPVGHWLIPKFMSEGRPFAIGPNVLYGDSQQPGACGGERELEAYNNFAAVFTLSRWYSALQQRRFAQKAKHHVLDYPLPDRWLSIPWAMKLEQAALIFVKGGQPEMNIAAWLAAHFAGRLQLSNTTRIAYGQYRREDLLRAAAQSRACFYISREDHYPLAAVEIGLMGCPIISDERSCPVVAHGLTGIVSPVRERGESDAFAWTPDAAERMAAEFAGACQIDRVAIRDATIRRHSPALCRERVAAALGLG